MVNQQKMVLSEMPQEDVLGISLSLLKKARKVRAIR